MTPQKILLLLGAAAMFACSPTPTTEDSGMDNDAAIPADGSTDDAATGPLECQANVPTANFGSSEGRNFAPLTLPSCSTDGGDYPLYNQDFCSNQLTVVVISAGWCVPCMMEAPMIEEQITSNPDYAGKVRVISVYFQNPDYSTPTATNCRNWQTRYGLTSHMVIDPQGLTQMYAPGLAFPANILINQHGQIVYREFGEDLPGLVNAIQQNLQ